MNWEWTLLTVCRHFSFFMWLFSSLLHFSWWEVTRLTMLPMSKRPTLVKADWKRLGFFKGSRAELETSGLLGAVYPVLWGDPGKSHPHAIGSRCKDWGTSCQLRAFVWAFKAFMSSLRQPPLRDSRESCLESHIPIAWNEIFWHF